MMMAPQQMLNTSSVPTYFRFETLRLVLKVAAIQLIYLGVVIMLNLTLYEAGFIVLLGGYSYWLHDNYRKRDQAADKIAAEQNDIQLEMDVIARDQDQIQRDQDEIAQLMAENHALLDSGVLMNLARAEVALYLQINNMLTAQQSLPAEPITWPINPVDEQLNHLSDEVLEDLRCPILQQVMQDPVRAGGHCYERWALQAWYDSGKRYCPLVPSTVLVDPKTLPTDETVKAQVQQLLTPNDTTLVSSISGENEDNTEYDSSAAYRF